MRKICLLLTILISMMAFAQEDLLPAKVKDSFYEKYPLARSVNWYESDKIVHIEFDVASNSYTALYSMEGSWIETGKIISDMEIPDKVINSIDSKHSDFEISFGEYIETDKQEKYYRINGFTSDDDYIIKVSPEGKILGEKKGSTEFD